MSGSGPADRRASKRPTVGPVSAQRLGETPGDTIDMRKRRLTDFQRCVLASRLLTRQELEEALAALGAPGRSAPEASETEDQLELPTDEQLAQKLVEMGRLNLWQSRQLLEGRTRFNLGPYRIVDYLGRGGMGRVFKGYHEVSGEVAAIKVLPKEKSTPEAVRNFRREIQLQARLNHPNLVRALDAGYDGNVYYMVSEYVPGTNLRRLVRRHGPLSMEAAASIISQVAAGLDHAHQQGLVHRDVKPANVLVTPDGHAKLSDLGLAGPLTPDPDDSRLGKIVGTADYLSPDLIKSPWDPKPAWDIYSLGCTLYYAVTAKVPFPQGTAQDKARAHCQLRPLDPRRLNPSLSAAFVDVLADMMAKDPAERIATAEEVIRRLAPWTLGPAPIGPRAKQKRETPEPASGPPASQTFRNGAPEDLAEDPLEETKSSFSDFFAGLAREIQQVAGQAQRRSSPPATLWKPVVVFVLLPATTLGLIALIVRLLEGLR